MPIRYYLNNEGVYSPVDIRTMSMALDDVCKELRLDGHAAGKEAVAIRIIELARRGERSPTKLRDRVLAEAKTAEVVSAGQSQ
jgi:hypothetical protein